MSKLKAFLKAHPGVLRFLTRICNRLPFNNSIRGKRGNRLLCNGIMRRCKISFHGKNNTLEICDGVRLENCSFHNSGSNNHILLKERVYGKNIDLCTENDGNRIVAGERTAFCGKIHLACIEGTSIIIGKDCLFSSDIVFRTGDSHAVTDMDGNRINPSKDIVFGDHIWMGHRTMVTKGVHIGNDNIIGTGAVVTKSFPETNRIIAGVPAKVVKTDINWDGQR
jgi:acetyltransferase-like isoleucine patch superfamily enzyme